MSNRTTEPLPAGEYWVGDPCYAFKDHDLWIAWINAATNGNGEPQRIMDGIVNGMRVVASHTAYGDGLYDASNGKQYAVDAGLLGVVPSSLTHDIPDGMTIETFREPFHIHYEAGNVCIGHITIFTDYDAEYDED